VAGFRRNGRPDCVGISGRIGSDYALARTEAKLLTICFGAPLAIGFYYLQSRLFRACMDSFGQLAGG